MTYARESTLMRGGGGASMARNDVERGEKGVDIASESTVPIHTPIHTCETTVCVTWKSSVSRSLGISAVKLPSMYCTPGPSPPPPPPPPWKSTICPSAPFANRLVGRITVGRQHEAWTAERTRTCGVVRALSRRAPRGPVPREEEEMLMLTTRLKGADTTRASN